MKYFFSIIRSSLKDLAANKLRSFLTMLGIIIGIASVILVMAIGRGAQELIISQVTQIGTDLIGVLPGQSESDEPPIASFVGTVTSLKVEDARAMEELSTIAISTPYATGRDTITYGNNSDIFDFTGVSEAYVDVEATEVAKGRFLSKRHVDSMARVCVLGHEVKEELFGWHDPIGERVRLRGQNFEVIGVMEERGSHITGNLDSQIFIPITTAQKVLLGIDYVNLIRAKMKPGVSENLVRAEVEQLLRHRHNISDPSKDDFSVRTMAQLLDILGNVTGAIQGFLVMVVAISLLVGGVGIMNIMLVSLSEKIREVGLRKALGATDRSILIQFLSESTLLSFFGGILGITFGLGLGLLISYLIRLFSGLEWQFLISPLQVLSASLVAISIGLIFGIYPAWKASKLDPIDALRYE